MITGIIFLVPIIAREDYRVVVTAVDTYRYVILLIPNLISKKSEKFEKPPAMTQMNPR